jgi:hypothetical protein
MEKQKREAHYRADMMLTTARSMGAKKAKHSDFLPKFAKKAESTPEEKEAKLKQFLMGLAKKNESNG